MYYACLTHLQISRLELTQREQPLLGAVSHKPHTDLPSSTVQPFDVLLRGPHKVLRLDPHQVIAPALHKLHLYLSQTRQVFSVRKGGAHARFK